jgi:hypothetical protein
MFSSFFGSNPYGGIDTKSDMYNTVDKYYQPYMDAGTSSLSSLQEQIARMYGDPGALYADLGKGFKQSPGYEYNINQATQGANRAAAAGGQLGSTGEQLALSKQISGMADQDYGNYMNSMMGLYGQGVQGLQGLTGMGYKANSDMAGDMANAQMAQYGLDIGSKKSQQGIYDNMWGTAGQVAGMFF